MAGLLQVNLVSFLNWELMKSSMIAHLMRQWSGVIKSNLSQVNPVAYKVGSHSGFVCVHVCVYVCVCMCMCMSV